MFYGGSNYIGGNAGVFNHSALNGLAVGGGLYNHPSFTVNRGIDYFAGTKKGNPSPDTYLPNLQAGGIQALQASLNAARDEQGLIGRFWDGLKNLTGIGLGSNKCQQYIDKAAVGQMSLEDAYSKISKYTMKQRGGVNLVSGLAAGALSVVAVSAAPFTGGLSILAGAGVGAATKAGLKTLDRATNEIDNDALDAKKIVKDGLSGALNGAVSSGVMLKQAKHVFEVNSAKEALKQGAIQGAKCGAISGAVMGAGDYTIECGFEADQKFQADDFITSTVYGAAAGAVLGGVTGGISTKNAYIKCFPNGGADGSPYTGGNGSPIDPNTPIVDGVYKDVNNLAGLPNHAPKTPASTTSNVSDTVYLGTSQSSNLPAVVQQNTAKYPDLSYLVYGQNKFNPATFSTKPLAIEAGSKTVTQPVKTEPLGLPLKTEPLGLPAPKDPVVSQSSGNLPPKVIYLDGPVYEKTTPLPEAQVQTGGTTFETTPQNTTGALKSDKFLHNVIKFLKDKLKH